MIGSPPAQVASLLARMGSVAPINAKPFDSTNEWFHVTSTVAPDYELFQKIRFRWPMIVGPIANEFALVYCKSPPNQGVWLHHLSTPDLQRQYSPGAYEVAVWSQQPQFSALVHRMKR